MRELMKILCTLVTAETEEPICSTPSGGVWRVATFSSGRYNSGVVCRHEDGMGVRPSRAFRESLPCFAEAPSEAEGIAEGGPAELPTPNIAVPRGSSQTFFITFFLYCNHR